MQNKFIKKSIEYKIHSCNSFFMIAPAEVRRGGKNFERHGSFLFGVPRERRKRLRLACRFRLRRGDALAVLDGRALNWQENSVGCASTLWHREVLRRRPGARRDRPVARR
jgi:hypothetical protein